MSRSNGFWLSLLFGAGLLAVYVGERLISGGGRVAVSVLGVLLLLAALGLRALRWRRAVGEARGAEGVLLALYGVGALAVAVYFAQSEGAAAAFGESLRESAPRLRIALAALFPALVVIAAFPILLVELAFAAMARAPLVEGGRIREALFSGLGLAFAIIFAFTTVYVFTVRDTKWDLSYFRTARPGTSTQNLVASLEEPVDVYLFFPPANDVREELRSYFDDLARTSPNLRVHELDQAVDLQRARDLGVSSNGTVVLSRGARNEKLQFGQRLEVARTQLRNLDRDAQKALLKIARSKRVLYLTAGHGERSETKAGGEDARSPVTVLKDLLTQQNYEVRPLGLGEGLAIDVPEDAGLVMILGPTRPFLDEELASLRRYFEGGGRLFVAIDAESPVQLEPLLSAVGLKFDPTVLANDQVFIPRNRAPSDRSWLVAASYSSHPSVSTLSNPANRWPMAFVRAGAFEQRPDRPGEVSIDFTVHSHGATWADENGNFELDPPDELRKIFELSAAVTRKPRPGAPAEEQGRMIVLADSDAVADGIFENRGNAVFVLDGLRWLVGEESLAGEITSEVDVPVVHTRTEDVAVFYSAVFLVPAAILAVGFLATRRGRKAARKTEGGR